MSGGADGLVKVWTVRSDECESTLDGHTEKVWALTTAHAPPARAEEMEEGEDVETAAVGYGGPNAGLVVVSGGADSVINVWKDVTAREEVGRSVGGAPFDACPCRWIVNHVSSQGLVHAGGRPALTLVLVVLAVLGFVTISVYPRNVDVEFV